MNKTTVLLILLGINNLFANEFNIALSERNEVTGIDQELLFPELNRIGDVCAIIFRYKYTAKITASSLLAIEEDINNRISSNTEWVEIDNDTCRYGAQSMVGFCRLNINKRQKELSLYLCATE